MIGLWGEMGHPWRYILSYGKYFKWIVSSLMTAGTPTLHQHTFCWEHKADWITVQYFLFSFSLHFEIHIFSSSYDGYRKQHNGTSSTTATISWLNWWNISTNMARHSARLRLLQSFALCFSISDQTVVVVIDDPAFCFRCQGPLHTWTVIPQQKPRIAVCNTLCLNNFLSLLQ